jgi:hypothetical protein
LRISALNQSPKVNNIDLAIVYSEVVRLNISVNTTNAVNLLYSLQHLDPNVTYERLEVLTLLYLNLNVFFD